MAEQPKILVVEDDPDMAETVRIILESKNYQVIIAASREEGLAKVKLECPNLILLDVMMPEGTEGFHFVWELRRDPEPRYRNIPILVVTAIHGTTELRFYPDQSDGTYEPGAYLPVQDFVDKPVKPNDLLERVERLLKTGSA